MKKYIKITSALCALVLSSACLSSCFSDGGSDVTQDTTSPAITTEEEVTTSPEVTDATTEVEETTDKNAGLTAAPDLTVYDMSGKTVKLSDFFGKPIVLNFWASWCGPCKSEFPAFAEVCREYDDKVTFLFINCFDGATETMRTVQNFINGNGYSDLSIYLDKTGARQAYGVAAIPFTFFINEDGYIVNSLNTSISKDRLLSEIAKIYTPAQS